jgi:predicted NBD/HSP70 family sugar kinase
MQTIGLDIGGSKIRAVLWNGKRVIRAREFPTPTKEKDFRKTLLTLIASLARQETVRGIGIGAAGIVEKTTLISSPNIPYIKRLDFRDLWPRPMPLRVDNDARCFARAEFVREVGRGAKSLFGLTIGTGVGRAYGKNRKIIRIKKLEYPERWETRYQTIRDRGDYSGLAEFLAENLSPLIRPLKPEVIAIGGGVLERRGFLRRLRREFKARGLPEGIHRTRLTKNAVAIGAALLVS